MASPDISAVLLMSCTDQPGLVASITQFIFSHGGNILHLDQHVDQQENVFFMRVEWELAKFDIAPQDIQKEFAPIAEKFAMTWQLHISQKRLRMAVFVSKESHVLYDVLARWQSDELQADIPLIISNHPDLGHIAEKFRIPFYVIPMDKTNKPQAEARQLELLAQHHTDLIVLAKYMQIVSESFIQHYPNRIINIHHSFLPAFVGAKPYHQAFTRGVKIIGATSHYVTADLDAGPIIEQDVARVTHKDSVADLVRKGKDLEKTVLSRALYYHLQHRILAYNNKTVVFV
jgi:formyltetrahydrofolate deformylase